MCNKAKIRIKNTFADIIFYTTIVKKSCKNIERFVKNKWSAKCKIKKWLN